MSQLRDLLRHEVGSAAGFHHNGAGFEIHQVLHERRTSKLFAVNS
ncbi:hypothetical protein HK44_024955 [Pseudomonas fluorescens HK44]|uniref:Uncharacterized protein n=1 Tax=Pseudomonas fluorescens HK44 TaxID=1042209 RepID=A0A010SRW7_PSEFL|nr:hypothetical protein HK44_024955 [Pseudomonas fluorescens HK44]